MYDEYVDPEAPVVLKVRHGKCDFEGNLLQRKDGGFDLFLFRPNSEFECLEIAQITWLREQAQGDDMLLVDRFSETAISRELKKNVQESFVRWLESRLGLAAAKSKVRWEE